MGPKPFGLILAGGLSRRMGGGDKPLLEIGGKAILARVIARALPQCAGLALNANGDPARFAAYRLPVVPDSVVGFAGPLAGILAGLDWLAAQGGAEMLLSLPADTPFIPVDLAARLESARQEAGAMLACAASGGHTHPVIGLWPVVLRAELRRALVDEDIRKIDRFTARYSTAVAQWPVTPYDPFFNANAPDDLEAARSIAEKYDE